MLLNQEGIILALGIIFLWLITLSLFLYQAVTHYRKLTAGTEKQDLGSILEKILKEQEITSKRIGELEKRAERQEKAGLDHIQKIGLVRFNPFSETGGDQSFTMAILDGKDSGFVLSSLHARENTRIYAKPIKEGKPVGYQLSQEESQAIQQARKKA